MYNLKLPDIEPARPVPSAADAIDRAGSQFQQAAGVVGNALLQRDMAQVATQMQEATLQTTKGLSDTLDFIQRNPYLKPERVKALFGGKVPPDIRLSDKVATPAGEVEQPREAVPMHEVVPFLFDQQSKATVDNAARGISEEGWQSKFRMAAAQDVERARQEALNWQRAQSLADAQIRSVSQFQQAVASRSWSTAQAILNNADFTMDVKTRETLRNEFPKMRTMAGIEDRLRYATSLDDLDKLARDIDANRVVDPTKKPIIENADGTFSTERTTTWTIGDKYVVMPTIVDGKEYTPEQALQLYKEGKIKDAKAFDSADAAEKYAQERHNNEEATREGDRGAFYAKLTAEEQYTLNDRIRSRKHELEAEQERAEKRAAEKRFEDFGDVVQVATEQAKLQGRPVTDFVSTANIPLNLKFHEYATYKNWLEAVSKTERKTDNRVWLELSDLDKAGKLASKSKAEMMGYWPGLSEQDQRTWMDRWAAAKSGGSNKPLFSDTEDKTIDAVLTDFYKFDPKKNPVLFQNAKALLQKNMLVWRSKFPDQPMLWGEVLSVGASTFNANTNLNRGWLTVDPDTQQQWTKKYFGDGDADAAMSALVLGVGAAAPGRIISVQDLQTHLDQMNQERALVSEAWSKINKAADLSGTARATVHSVLVNPAALEIIDRQLADDGKQPNQRNRIYRIVENMQIPQSVPYEQEEERKAAEDAQRRQVTAAGEELNAQNKAQTAASRAAAKAAAAVERDRWNALPYWQQRAETLEKDALQQRESEVEAQIRGRVLAEDRAAQWAEANAAGRRYIVGKRFEDDPVRREMEKRIKAEVAAQRVALQNDVRMWFSGARSTYAAMLSDFQAGDPATVILFNKFGLDSFDNYVKARREGKVP